MVKQLKDLNENDMMPKEMKISKEVAEEHSKKLLDIINNLDEWF